MGPQVLVDSDQPDQRVWVPSQGSPQVGGGQSPGPADWPAPRKAPGPQTWQQWQRRKAVSDRLGAFQGVHMAGAHTHRHLRLTHKGARPVHNPGMSSSHTKTAPTTHLGHQQQTHRDSHPPAPAPTLSCRLRRSVSQPLLLLSAPHILGLSQPPHPHPRSNTVHHPGLDETTHTPSN